MFKRLRTLFLLLFFLFWGVICFKLFLLEIDFHYGNLAEIFYESQDGYIVHNVTRKQIAQIEKTWNRLYIIENENRVELKDWMNDDKEKATIIIYRPEESGHNITNMSESEFEKLVEHSKFTHITSN